MKTTAAQFDIAVGDPDERTGLTNGTRTPILTYERMRLIGNLTLVGAVAATGVGYGLFYDKGWWVLGLTAAGGLEMFGLAQNLNPSTRRILVYLVANTIYELFLPPYTAARANPTNKPLQYLPQLVLMVGIACFLEYALKAVTDTHKQIVHKDADIAVHPSDKRFFGPYPMTSESLKYCAVQLLPIAAGTACAIAGSQTSGIPAFMLQSSGYRLLAGGVGAIVKNIFDKTLRAMQNNESRRKYSLKTASLMGFNNFITGISKIAAPFLYALSKRTGKLPVMTGTGFLEGWQREETQRLLETYGRDPPDRQQLTAVKIAIVAAIGVFGLALDGYIFWQGAKTNNTPTWAATGGILGCFLASLASSVGIQTLWKNPAERAALLWLTRLFLAEYPNWLGYLAADLNHARQMQGSTNALVIAGLVGTAGTIGLDLTRGLDIMRVSQWPSPFGAIALTGLAELTPSSFPVPTGNRTIGG